MKLFNGFFPLILICIVGGLWTGCGFQSRKYTHGHYFNGRKEPTSNCTSTAVLPVTAKVNLEGAEINDDSEISQDDNSSCVLLGNNQKFLSDHFDGVTGKEEMIIDTTIRGSQSEVEKFPNQKEEPQSFSEFHRQSKAPILQQFVTTGSLAIIAFVLVALMFQVSGIEDRFSWFFLVLPFLLLASFFYFRRKWRKSLLKWSDQLDRYREFNKNELWFKSSQEKMNVLQSLIFLSMILLFFLLLLCYPFWIFYFN